MACAVRLAWWQVADRRREGWRRMFRAACSGKAEAGMGRVVAPGRVGKGTSGLTRLGAFWRGRHGHVSYGR